MGRRWLTPLVLWCLASPLVGRADSLSQVFARANLACARGQLADAIAGYNELVSAGVDDPDVRYNLATTHALAGEYGQAIRHYERTLVLAPSDVAARHHLEQARQALGQKLARQSGEAVVATRAPLTEAMFSAFRADTLAIALLCAAFLLTLCLFALQRTHTEAARLGLGILGALSMAVAGLSGFGLGVKCDWGAEGHRALVIHDDVPLRDGPDDAAQSSLRLREGTPVRLLSREQRFVEVELPGQRRGYVPATDVGEI